MPINAEFPAWMQQQNRDDTAAGIAIGRNIMEGFRLKQQQIAFESEAPVRAAQLEAYRAQTKASEHRAAAEAFALKQAMAGQGKMADALKFSADMAIAGGYGNPDNRIRFYDFLAKNPELAPTPWAKEQNDLFQTADDFERKKVELQSIYQRNIDVANIRADASEAIADARLSALEGRQSAKDEKDRLSTMTPEELREHFGGDMDKVLAFQTTLPGGHMIPKARAFVENTAKALEPYGVKLDDAQKALLTSQYYSGVKSTQAPDSVVKDINTEGSGYSRLDKLLGRIESVDSKYGDGTWDKAVGPFDSKKLEWKMRLVPPGATKEDEQEIRSLIRQANFIVQAYRNKQFGSALTDQEYERFLEIIGSPSMADYKQGLKDFKDSLRGSLIENLESYKLAGNVPIRWRAWLFSLGEGQTPAATGTPSAPASTDGNVIQFDVLPDGSVKRR